MELSQKELEEMVVGKPEKPRAIFFEQAVLNVPRSKEANRRVYDKKIFVRPHHPGIRDSVSYEAKKQDFIDFAEEWEYFKSTKQGSESSPGVDIIPGLQLEHLQELRDVGILNVRQLATANNVPPYLEYARKSAVVLHQVFEEQKNASKEESKHEENQRDHEIEAKDVPPVRRQEQHDHVRRPEAEGSAGVSGRGTSEGHAEDRQAQRGEGSVGYNSSIDNWSVVLQMR